MRTGSFTQGPATLLRLAVLAALAAGCSDLDRTPARGPAASSDSRVVGGLGQPVVQGAFENLIVSPDGRFGAYLSQTERPRLEGVNPLTRVGTLHVAKLEAGAGGRQLGTQVSNLPGGYLFSPDSRFLLFLSGYSPATREGQLQAVDLAADPSVSPPVLGKAVTFLIISPDSKWVAVVDGGILKVGPLGGAALTNVSGEVSSAEFSADGQGLVFQRKVSAAAGLFHVSAGNWTVLHKIGEGVGNYTLASDGKHVAFTQRSSASPSNSDLFVAELPKARPLRVAVAVGPFGFSPDGTQLARVESTRYEKRPNQVVGALFVGPASGSAARKLSDAVPTEKPPVFSFAPDSKAIAWFEPPTRKIGKTDAWQLGAATLPDGRPKIVGDQVPNYRWGADGTALAFVQHVLKPIYSVDLSVYHPGQDAAVKAAPGVYGYGFAPKNAALLFRTHCTELPKGCDLYSLNPLKPAEPARKLLDKIFDFRSSEDGSRLLVTYQRVERGELYDAAVFNLKSGVRKTLEQRILWPPYFLAKDGSKVGYLVGEKQRAGLYVATEVP